MSGRDGSVARPFVALALLATATAAVGLRADTVSAAPATFTKIPTRLYMVPDENSGAVPDLLAGLFIPIDHMMFDDLPVTGDVISRQSRVIEISAEETVSCRHEGTDGTGATPDTGDDFDLTGCTALQLAVSHGTLKFDPAPSEIDDPTSADAQFKMYRFASGALLREADDPGDLEQATLALIGTAAQVNQTIKTLVYTPTVDDPGTANTDEGYYYNGSNPEALVVQLVPGDTTEGGSVTRSVDIKVLDYNDFPEMTLHPTTTWSVASGADLEMFDPGPNPLSDDPDVATVVVADEDNDDVIENPNDGEIDGKGKQFLLAAWTTCGTFSIRREADFTIRDDLEAIFDEIWDRSVDSSSTPDTDKETAKEAFFEVLPDEVENLPFASEQPDEPHKAFIGITNDIEDLNWALGQMTFHAADKAGVPLGASTCKLRVLVSDLGNNGLPLQYLGDPPTGAEIPMFGFDLDTNHVPTVEEFTIDVDGGGPVTPTITSVSDVTLAEGTGGVTTPFTFTLSLDAPAPVGGATVDVATSHTGAAPNTNDIDLTPITATPVTFAEGATSATFTVPVDHDAADEPDEHFQLLLSNPAGVSIGDASGLGTVQNDDGPDAPPQIVTFTGDTHVEGNASTTDYEFDITLSEPAPAGGASVWFSTSHGTTDDADVTTTSGQLVLFAQGETTRTITASVNGDTDVEPTETFTATLSNPDGLTIAAAAQSATGTITTDDFRTVVIDDVSLPEGNAGTTAFTFTLTLDGPAVGGESAQVSTGGGGATPGVDYASLNDELVTFAVGSTTAAVTVDVNGDPTFEGDDVFLASLDPNTLTFLTIDDGTGQGTILNDDAAPDVVAPTVTINQGATQTDPTSVAPIIFDVVFSEPVSGFTDSDVILAGTAGATTAVVTPITASAYTVAVSGMTADGSVIATIPLGAAADAAMNASAASTSTDNTVTYDFDEGDVTAPTVTINQGAAQPDPTTVSPITFDVVFSEPVTGFTASDVQLSGAAMPTTAVISGSGATYTVAVSGMSLAGSVVATIPAGAATDAALNLSAEASWTDNEVMFLLDTTKPSVTIDQGGGQTDPTSVSPIVFDVQFSELVTGFTDADVALAGTAMATTAVVSGSGSNYTVSVSGMVQDGTVIATIPAGAAVDSSMNASNASTSTDNTVTYDFDEGDITAPTVTINQGAGQADPTSVSPIVFDVVFSEPVTGFADADVQLSGTALATTAAVNGSGASYTVSVSGMTQDGTVVASVPASAATDAANNPSAASTSADNVVTFDFVEVQPPDPLTITVPADITVPNDPAQPGAVVTYPAPTTSGGVAPVTVVCSSPSGGFYPIGVTTVTCTATDSAQDQQQVALAVATDSFTITVVDTTPPTTTPPDTTQPGTTAPPVTPPATQPPSSVTAPNVGELPATGGDSRTTVAIAAATLLVGLALLAVRRRTRPAS